MKLKMLKSVPASFDGMVTVTLTAGSVVEFDEQLPRQLELAEQLVAGEFAEKASDDAPPELAPVDESRDAADRAASHEAKASAKRAKRDAREARKKNVLAPPPAPEAPAEDAKPPEGTGGAES